MRVKLIYNKDKPNAFFTSSGLKVDYFSGHSFTHGKVYYVNIDENVTIYLSIVGHRMKTSYSSVRDDKNMIFSVNVQDPNHYEYYKNFFDTVEDLREDKLNLILS